jgi:hypothetical protein
MLGSECLEREEKRRIFRDTYDGQKEGRNKILNE